MLSTPIYTAKATLQIDREVANVVNMQNVQPQEEQGESEEFYQTQYGLLKSPALAERVISTLGLANSPLFLHAAGLKPLPADQQNAARARAVFDEKVFKKVSSSLAVDPVRGSRLVALSFDSPDPNIAAQVANSFADNFIQTNLERRFEFELLRARLSREADRYRQDPPGGGRAGRGRLRDRPTHHQPARRRRQQ